MRFSGASVAALAGVATWCMGADAATLKPRQAALPTVDLGYEIHQAFSYNNASNSYNFTNIRYAAPPVGRLRFAAPQAPAVNRTGVQTGSTPRVCAQARPYWGVIAGQAVPQYLTTGQTNITAVNIPAFTASTPIVPPLGPIVGLEDCLFLDVVAPRPIFENAGKKGSKGAPVIVWIYGGGFTAGDKAVYNPNGLLQRGNSSFVYVALNYRTGALGWLSSRKGGKFQSQGGTANAGLYDQRFALEWVQKHIAKFGGDPRRVTVLGESAGGASIMHQITAYGGERYVPFQKAIPQSPGFLPVVSNDEQDAIYNKFLTLANAPNLAALRNLSTEAILRANLLQVLGSNYGSYTFGPAVDDIFVPDLPGRLLAKGCFAKSVDLLVGHNANEGLLFVSPLNANPSYYAQNLRTTLPSISNATISTITDSLYPATFSAAGASTLGYSTPITRAALTTADLAFVCNTYYLALASRNTSHNYLFAIPPALHGDDLSYTFFAGANGSVRSVPAAVVLQDWVTSFAATGRPSSASRGFANVPPFPAYGANATIAILSAGGVAVGRDDAANARCAFWQRGEYAPAVNFTCSNCKY